MNISPLPYLMTTERTENTQPCSCGLGTPEHLVNYALLALQSQPHSNTFPWRQGTLGRPDLKPKSGIKPWDVGGAGGKKGRTPVRGTLAQSCLQRPHRTLDPALPGLSSTALYTTSTAGTELLHLKRKCCMRKEAKAKAKFSAKPGCK